MLNLIYFVEFIRVEESVLQEVVEMKFEAVDDASEIGTNFRIKRKPDQSRAEVVCGQ